MTHLKFRIWDKSYNKWLDYEEIFIDQEGDIYLIEERNWAYQTYMHKENITNKVDVIRYSSLKDINGKEVYEGDILGGYGKWVVTYVDDTDSASLGMPMGWYEQRDNFESWRQLEVGDDVEVIGNIYENPDLLK